MNKGKEPQKPGARKFPVILLIVTAILSSIASAYGGISAVILSLGYLMFTMSFFLILIIVFCKIKTLKYKQSDEKPNQKSENSDSSFLSSSRFLAPIKRFFNSVWTHITNFYSEESEETDNAASGLPAAVSETPSNGLIAIQKNVSSKHSQENEKKSGPVFEFLYVVTFFVIALWRLTRMFAIVPLYLTQFSYSIIDAVLMLVFPCVAIIYLKMRKDEGSCPGDKTSRDLLTLLSFVSLVYAAVISVTLVLNADILGVLQLIFYAAMTYLTAVFAWNILLSVLSRKVIGDFNYRLIPKFSKNENKETSFLDSEDIRRNFSLKSLYTIKYTLKVLPGLFLGLVFVLLLSTTIFAVQPHQQAAVYRFGSLQRSSIVGEGLHFKLPWPIDKVSIYNVHRINAMQIGYTSPDNIHFLSTQFHTGGDSLLLLGNGNEKVSVNMRIIYNISDLYAYITNNTNPETILSAAAYEALMNRTVNTTLDAFLSIDRSSLSASILEELSEFSRTEGLGLEVVQVIIEGIHPPVEIAHVYQMVISASIDRNTIVKTAQTEAERKLIDADRQNISIVNYAKARQYSRISAAQQEMAVFFAAMEAHQINSESFELTRTLEVFENVIGGSKVYVFSQGMEGSIQRSVLGQLNTPNILGISGVTHE